MIIKEKKFSNNKTLICVPIVGKNKEDILSEINFLKNENFDAIEWRVDFFNENENINKILEILNLLNELNLPIIFTFRNYFEGGQKNIENNLRKKIINEIIISKKIDLIDIELENPIEFINYIKENCKKNNVKLILSNHNFLKTPEKNEIENILERMINLDSDICKIAYKPNNKNDVIKIINISNDFNNNYNKLLISISMDKLGLITRIGGNIFGSCLTFASGKENSAPGQISISKLKNILDILE